MRPAAVLLGPGINCHEESVFAIEQAGMDAEVVLVSDLAAGREDLCDRPGVMVPGGFAWGDHFGAGRVLGLALSGKLRDFAATGRPMLGVCNGFQVFVEAGLFDAADGSSGGALVQNVSGRFESRWTTVVVEGGSPWAEGMEGEALRMPVAHGEGRWLRPECPDHLTTVFRYCNGAVPTEEYPANPSGTPEGVTGLANGLVLGMMPHPERATLEWQGSTSGRRVFAAFARLMRL
jgi:phosphoribosylformylglycinamidine synthase I